MNVMHKSFFGFKRQHISQSENFLEEHERNHWVWHLLLAITVIFILLSQSINDEFVKHWLIATLHSSGIKEKYLEMLKFGLLGLAGGCTVLWFLRKNISNDWRATVARWREIPPGGCFYGYSGRQRLLA